jgi:hypothetical protein
VWLQEVQIIVSNLQGGYVSKDGVLHLDCLTGRLHLEVKTTITTRYSIQSADKKNSPPFIGPRNFSMIFTRSRHCTLYELVESSLSSNCLFKINFNIILPSMHRDFSLRHHVQTSCRTRGASRLMDIGRKVAGECI